MYEKSMTIISLKILFFFFGRGCVGNAVWQRTSLTRRLSQIPMPEWLGPRFRHPRTITALAPRLAVAHLGNQIAGPHLGNTRAQLSASTDSAQSPFACADSPLDFSARPLTRRGASRPSGRWRRQSKSSSFMFDKISI